MMTTAKRTFDPQTQHNIDQWLKGDYDPEAKLQVLQLIKDDPQLAINAFYTTLSFGTGGLRGIVGVGTNRMNKYTVRTATQGLANYLRREVKGTPSVLIGYDCRRESPLFAQEAARVLAGNGIHVYLFRQLRPTPLISFGCRAKNCNAAIMLTASHNPPHYNGYKVYWSDGGQILPPHDKGIIDEIHRVTSLDQIQVSALHSPLIHWIDEEIDDEYLRATDGQQLHPKNDQAHGRDLHVVYSNLHGTGITLVPKILARWGFTNLTLVQEQAEPDPNFPTVKSANPEERAALQLGIETLLACKGDILLATDPDADRVGVAVRTGDDVELLNGNQISAVCLDAICQALTEQKRLPPRAACVKTIVTTPLFAAIALHYGLECVDVLPGFKYISAKIHDWESHPNGYHFVYGGEESYGYLLGTASRDKDAVISCALLCEVALQAKQKGITLVDWLHSLYQKYGVHRESLQSITYPETKEGREKMASAIAALRQTLPKRFGNIAVRAVKDYLQSAPAADILQFSLEDGSWLVVRPSGTEPKVKIYAGTADLQAGASVKVCDHRLDELLQQAKALLT